MLSITILNILPTAFIHLSVDLTNKREYNSFKLQQTFFDFDRLGSIKIVLINNRRILGGVQAL